MIRHAGEAAVPVGPLPVAVIEPSLPALLVSPVGDPPLLPPRFPPAALARSIGAPGHNDDRSRTPRHSRPPGRTAAAGALRWAPSPPFRRDSTAATPHGDLDPICRCPFFTLRGAERVPLLSREHVRIGHWRANGTAWFPSERPSLIWTGRVKEIRDASPQALHHFTRFDQVNQLVGASEADPDMGFMARLLALCSLPRTNPGNQSKYVRRNGPYTLGMTAGINSKLPFGNIPRLLLAWLCTEAVRTQNRVLVLGSSLSEFMRKLGMEDRSGSARGDRTRLPQPDEAPLSLSD